MVVSPGNGLGADGTAALEAHAVSKNQIEELYERYQGVFEPWKVNLAFARLKHFGVPLQAWDDALQELSIVIHRFRFDPARAHAASEETILCRILDRRIKMLARTNARRRNRLHRFSLLAHRTEDTRLPEQAAMATELREAMGTLSARRQTICRLMMGGEGIMEIAETLGLHHETVRRHVRFIRERFIEKGINPWSD